eukprot:9375654-Pyramimonas_sp.AAC.1
MVGGRDRGRCLTTTPGCDDTVPDPRVEAPLQVTRFGLSLWRQHHEVHDRACRAWGQSRTRLRPSATRRRARVRGPISTDQAALMDIGWDLISATTWFRPTELDDEPVDQWELPRVHDQSFASTTPFQELLHDVAADIRGH